MKVGEAIRYFERELEKIEEAEAIEASAAEPDEELLHAWGARVQTRQLRRYDK